MTRQRFQPVIMDQTRGFPVDLREVCLIHFKNLSDEIVKDGLKREYEPALDRLMNWLYYEFCEHHPDLKAEYDKAMGYKFGDLAITDRDRVERIQMKERLLSRLLAKHNIDLGKSQTVEVEQSAEQWDHDTDIDQAKEPDGTDLLDDSADAK